MSQRAANDGIVDIVSLRGSSTWRTRSVASEDVAPAQSAIVADDLAAGRLIEPFALRIPSGMAYYLVAPPLMFQSRKVAAFHGWLRQQIAAGGD